MDFKTDKFMSLVLKWQPLIIAHVDVRNYTLRLFCIRFTNRRANQIKRQICHRDLKLENTLLDGSPAPRLKICDFGYSKSYLLHSLPKSTVGTPAYIAPEVLSRRECSIVCLDEAPQSLAHVLINMCYQMLVEIPTGAAVIVVGLTLFILPGL
ncbi:unnamed protein product [Lupinus luteus]|uniref:non-specific serine/threonine protein kinase n=1 Tax=Lupinus luteus TaxID=3873 RepID=A0AAV1XB94_LUPLU